MFAVSVSLSISQSVCRSHGSTRLHCTKTAEQIKMPFGVNTPGGPLDRGPDPVQRGEGESMQPLPNYFGLLFVNFLNMECIIILYALVKV